MTRSVRSGCEWIGAPPATVATLLRLLRIDGFSKEARKLSAFGGQECRPKRKYLLFSIEVQVPKLDVAGSSPVSRSMFSTT
jgi:hypothetical protein